MSYKAIELIQSKLQQQLMQAYQLFDTRGKGFIQPSGLIQNMKTLGYQIDKKQVAQMIQYLDQGNKGVISKQSFLKFMTARLDYRDQAQQIRSAFDYLDQSSQGKIRMHDLQKICQQLGEEVQLSQKIIQEADKDGDGFLNFQQFMRVIKKTSYF